MSVYLIIKAAATLRTLGYLHSATIVNKLPARPVSIMTIATTAAKVLNGCGNLSQSQIIRCKKQKLDHTYDIYADLHNRYSMYTCIEMSKLVSEFFNKNKKHMCVIIHIRTDKAFIPLI